jgi:hypothetical protein
MITSNSNYFSTLTFSTASKTENLRFVDVFTYFQLIFGVGAIQTVSLLKISKIDLTGLQPITNNTGEGLLVALFLRIIAFSVFDSSKINAYKWGTSITQNICTNTLIFYLLNQLLPVDTYELPEPNNIVNPNDY